MRPRTFAFPILCVSVCAVLSAQASSGRLAADTPKTTVLGNTFVGPKDWSLSVKGPATILEAPEGGSWIALVDVPANSAEQALAGAWKAYKPGAKWPVKVSTDLPDKDGWSRRRTYDYLTSPNEKRGVSAQTSAAAFTSPRQTSYMM